MRKKFEVEGYVKEEGERYGRKGLEVGAGHCFEEGEVTGGRCWHDNESTINVTWSWFLPRRAC